MQRTRFTAKHWLRSTAVLLPLMCILASTGRAQSDDEEDVKALIYELVSEGFALRDKGSYGEAKIAFIHALEIDSTTWTAWHGLGMLYWDRSTYDSSIVCFRNALKHGGTDGFTDNWLATVLLEVDSLAAAEHHLRLAIARAPEIIDSYTMLAKICRKTGRRDSIPAVLESAERHADAEHEFLDIVSAWKSITRYDRSASLLERALTRDSVSAPMLWAYAGVLSHLHRCRDGITTIQRILDLDGPHPILYRALLLAALECGDTALADRVRPLIPEEDSIPGVDLSRIRALMAVDRIPDALTLIYSGLQSHPKNPVLRMYAVNCDFRSGRIIRACDGIAVLSKKDSAVIARLAPEGGRWLDSSPEAFCAAFSVLSRGDIPKRIDFHRDSIVVEPVFEARFPPLLPNATRQMAKRENFDEAGWTFKYALHDDEHRTVGTLTFFVYRPARGSFTGPWFILDANGKRQLDTTGIPGRLFLMNEPSQDFQTEYLRVKSDIGWKYQLVRQTYELRFIASERRRLVLLQSGFDAAGERSGERHVLYLGAHDGWLFKVRVTTKPEVLSFDGIDIERLIRTVLGEA